MRYLIVEDEQGTPCMASLPARDSREEAQAECDRMNKAVKATNEDYERFQEKIKSGVKLERGEVFMHRQDKRVFSVKEIE